MDIEKSSDEDLLRSINDERGKYSSDFVSEIRLELLLRGYKEVNGVWKKLDRDAAVAELGVVVKGLMDRIDVIEKRGVAKTRVVDPKFLNRAFLNTIYRSRNALHHAIQLAFDQTPALSMINVY